MVFIEINMKQEEFKLTKSVSRYFNVYRGKKEVFFLGAPFTTEKEAIANRTDKHYVRTILITVEI